VSYLQIFDDIEQQAGGIEASLSGQGFDLYRLSNTTPPGGILSGSPLMNVNAIMERTTSRKVVDSAVFDLPVYQGVADARVLQLGDVLKETVGTVRYTGAAYTFVQRRPNEIPVFIATNKLCTIARSLAGAGRFDQQPTSGPTAASSYLGVSEASEWFLTLEAGTFAFAQSGTPVAVLCGLQPNARVRDAARDSAAGLMPSDLPIAQFIAYVPVLPGAALQETDILYCGTDRYDVRKVYTSEAVGVVGSVCVVEKYPLG
jgi:hypothetical protein